MDAKTWEEIKEIFAEVIGLDDVDRRHRLDELCDGDQKIRVEVEALLRSNDEVENFIEEPAFTVASALPTDAEPTVDKMIGHYRILREIGRGGMGTVFWAERDDGEFQQEVAIKVVSSAFLGRENLDRFRQERQILAGLNHPNIARLLDGGVTDDGLPYLVMEYVDGRSLIEHADTQNLSIDERLRLFLKICRAFAYAHGNLIVHRDIKPSNVLVTADGEPKLLDFGLAKILDIDNNRIRTDSYFRALTPAYASPEQIRGDQITTASDIYSLGVVLYELLTGSRPFNYDSLTFERMIEIASGSGPVPPSAALKKGGEKRRREEREKKNADSRLLTLDSRLLRGDIDNIVMMAMRSESDRRYRSVEQFANDIECHLAGLPISATANTFGYRGSKFVRRHWIGLASASIIVLTLIGGIIATTWQAREARRAQARSETVGSFLQNMLGSAAPEAKGSDVKVKDLLADAALRARNELADDPDALADVLLRIGRTYISLTLNDQAETELRAAVAVSEKANGEQHPVTAASLALLGMALGFQNKSDEGLRVSQRAVAVGRKLYPNGHEDLGSALYAVALNHLQRGEATEALPFALESSDIIRRFLGERHGYYLATINEIALVHERLGNIDEAEKYYRQTIEQGEGMDRRYRIYLAQASTYLGRILLKKNQTQDAVSHLKNAEAIYRDVLGDSNTSVAYILQILGTIHIERGEFEQAREKLGRSLEMFTESLPEEHGFVLQSKVILGLALTRSGKSSEAERHLREAKSAADKTLQPESALRAEIDSTLGECLTARRQFAEAEVLLLSSRSVQTISNAPPGHPSFETRRRLRKLYRAWHRPAEARNYE